MEPTQYLLQDEKAMWEIVDKLGPWPIIQIGVVGLVIYLSAMTYTRVLASKFPDGGGNQTRNGTPQEVSILYFQGWFKGVLDELGYIKGNQEMNRVQLREYIADRSAAQKHDMRSALSEVQAELKDDIYGLRNDIRELKGDHDDLKNLVAEVKNAVEVSRRAR